MTDVLPYGRQDINDADVAAVVAALESGWLTTGPRVERFECALAERVGARHAIAVNSGTAALHAAYFAAGLQPGDEVLTTPITFAATANAACYLGARPVFGDVEAGFPLLDPGRVEASISPATRIIAPVDFSGHPVNIDAFLSIAERHDVTVVQDSAHSLGAQLHGRPVGSMAHMTVFSFHPVKHVAMGEGGAVVTDDSLLYKRLRAFRTHGMVYDQPSFCGATEGGWYHEQQFLGFNYRVTDLQCALGISQLARLDAFLHRRNEIATRYLEAFADLSSLRLPTVADGVAHAWHLFVVQVEQTVRRFVFDALRMRGLGVQVHYIPVYRHPYYRQNGYAGTHCPEAEAFYSGCLTLPLFPAMKDEDVERVVNTVREVVGELERAPST